MYIALLVTHNKSNSKSFKSKFLIDTYLTKSPSGNPLYKSLKYSKFDSKPPKEKLCIIVLSCSLTQ